MSLAQRFERRLESLVGSAFARVFKGQVEPVEIGAALQREAADKRNVFPGGPGGAPGGGTVMCPNRYRVTLSPSDHERLVPWEAQLTVSLAELVQEHLDENGWTTIGDVEVFLALDESLHTGVFGVSSRMEAAAAPRSRPHDSLSIPIAHDPAGAHAGVPGGGAVPPPPQVHQVEPVRQAEPVYQQPGLGGAASAAAAAPGGAWAAPGYGGYAQPEPYGGEQYQPDRYHQPGSGPDDGGGWPGDLGGGPAAAPRQTPVSLVVDGTSDRLELRVGANLVGRGTEADLQLLDQGVSRRHAEVDFDGVHAICFDLGSTNGTTVNGHELGQQAVTLQHGDVVRVGHTRLVFTQGDR